MLRIATINTRKYAGCDDRYFQELSQLVTNEDFDILCFQDVPVTSGEKTNVAVQLAEKSGMTCSFAATLEKVKADKTTMISGSAILTGADCCMLSSGSFSLPGVSRKKKRKGQFAVVRKDGDAILVINIQLPLMKTSAERQRKQLQVIFEHPIMEKQYAAILFCGEFGIGQKGRSLKIFKQQSRFKARDGFSAHMTKSAVEDTHSLGRICLLESKKETVARVVFSNARQLLGKSEYVAPGRPTEQVAALDIGLTRIESDKVSQIHRYVSFIRPWSGPSEAEQGSSFQPSWLGQKNSFGPVNIAGC